MRYLTWLLVPLALLGLSSCTPGATLSADGEQYRFDFANPESETYQYAVVFLGEPVSTADARCNLEGEGITCDLGLLEPGEEVAIHVTGERISCEVYRLPVLRVYPCDVQ